MANNLHSKENGIPNGVRSTHLASESRPALPTRPLTLNETLPFTPITSINPFRPDIIPTPTIGNGPQSTNLSSLVPSADFEELNREAAASTGSKFLNHSLSQIQGLLERNSTSYKFKHGPQASRDEDRVLPSLPDISPFTKMVYRNVKIPVRYREKRSPSPPPEDCITVSPVPIPRTPRKKPEPKKLEPKKLEPKKLEPKKQGPESSKNHVNSDEPQVFNPTEIEIRIPVLTADALDGDEFDVAEQAPPFSTWHAGDGQGPVTPLRPAPHTPFSEPHASSIMIDISSSTPVNIQEFQIIPDVPDEPTNLSMRKRKREDLNSQDAYGDQAQRRDAALSDLHQFIYEIFEAERQAQHTGSDSHLVVVSEFKGPVLTAAAHSKLQTLVQKTISLGSYQHVPVDDLVKIQRMVDAALAQSENLETRIELSWTDGDVAVWARQLNNIDTALKAVRTTLQIMAGEREEKQLYSEDAIQRSLDIFRNTINNIVVPVAELRNAGNTANIFKSLSSFKKPIGQIFTSCQRILSLTANLIRSVELSEIVINTLESLSSQLMFVENGHAESNSVVGVQKFDGLRVVAMDMLTQIFLLNPDQRQRLDIFNEILTSLEKLPLGKQGARQFKLSDGGAIQPVSALIMRLVQASAGKVDDRRQRSRDMTLRAMELAEGGKPQQPSEATNGEVAPPRSFLDNEELAATTHRLAIQDLEAVLKPLSDSTGTNAHYVIKFLVERAIQATKSGDAPHRNLLDLFVEDFSTCLSSPDWPGAEVLLRVLSLKMTDIIEGDYPVQAKNMALDYLGIMCAAISKLRSQVRKMVTSVEGSSSDELGRFLSELGLAILERRSRPEQLVSWTGPYRTTLEYLEQRLTEDPHVISAISYMIVDWAGKVQTSYDDYNDEVTDRDQEFGRLAYRLRMMIEDRRWLSNEFSFRAVQSPHAKLSYPVTLLKSQFCELFGLFLNILLKSMASDQATVRSKSLKSINQVLETDPSILDGESAVITLILQCSNDKSTQVRDSALGLIGKCVIMRPSLEERMTVTVLERFVDQGVGVRKRAMKLARDIYLRNSSMEIRKSIATNLLHRVGDPDEGVRELARQLIEEVWITPFYNNAWNHPSTVSIPDHALLIVQTLKTAVASAVMDKVLQTFLDPKAKSADATFDVCKRLVAAMFDLIDNPDSDDPSLVSGKDSLAVLMIFAKANPKLFNFEQISLLRTRIGGLLGNTEDMLQARSVVVIYRRVLPQLSSAHAEFLADIRKTLMPAVSKSPRLLLDDLVACLWTISELLGPSEHLARVVLSSMMGVRNTYAKIRSEGGGVSLVLGKTFERYSLIVGMFGKHCDLDANIDTLRPVLPKWQGSSASKLMIDLMIPFAQKTQPFELRKPSLDAIGLVCQRWPRNYVSPNVYTTFQQVFDEENAVLEEILLKSFKEFLLIEEKRSEQGEKGEAGPSGDVDKKRELTKMGTTNFDDVASATTQRFLANITRIAMATIDDYALLAVEVLGTITRQGLVHPKETGVTLMTLGTCPVQKISDIAAQEYRALHEKHETVLEREYAKAVQSIFTYQLNIVGDPRGATANPFTPKLQNLMDVLKISKSKNRTKFFEKLCAQIDFDVNKLDVFEEVPAHVLFSRFITENLAFLDFVTVGELQSTINAMEKLVTRTGANVAHLVESEVFQVRMDAPEADQLANGNFASIQSNVSPQRLKQLTSASIILSGLWDARTHLRRLYSMSTKKEGKAKPPPKDLNKTPVKVQGVSGDRFWEDMTNSVSGLSSIPSMMQTCKNFVELLNVDKEHKIGNEDGGGEDPTTPQSVDDDDDGAGPNSERGRGKRKASNTPGGRKKRARSSSRARGKGRPRKQSLGDADGEFEEAPDWL